jgi:hypothetical protein
MNAEIVIEALQLPRSARVDYRVPKKLLIENGAPTPRDKRLIAGAIEETRWVATLKPTTVGVAAYTDDSRVVNEIAVLRLQLRLGGSKAGRVIELVHRAIPYPVVLVTAEQSVVNLSLADKRWSHTDRTKVVLDGSVVQVRLDAELDTTIVTKFLESLALALQPRTTLRALYLGWFDSTIALQAAQFTGTYRTAGSPELTAARRVALEKYMDVELEVSRLRASAAKERQVPRQVEINMELRRLQDDLAAVRADL